VKKKTRTPDAPRSSVTEEGCPPKRGKKPLRMEKKNRWHLLAFTREQRKEAGRSGTPKIRRVRYQEADEEDKDHRNERRKGH